MLGPNLACTWPVHIHIKANRGDRDVGSRMRVAPLPESHVIPVIDCLWSLFNKCGYFHVVSLVSMSRDPTMGTVPLFDENTVLPAMSAGSGDLHRSRNAVFC